MTFPDTTPKILTELCPFGCGKTIDRFDQKERVAHFENEHEAEYLAKLRRHGFFAEVAKFHGALDVYSHENV